MKREELMKIFRRALQEAHDEGREEGITAMEAANHAAHERYTQAIAEWREKCAELEQRLKQKKPKTTATSTSGQVLVFPKKK